MVLPTLLGSWIARVLTGATISLPTSEQLRVGNYIFERDKYYVSSTVQSIPLNLSEGLVLPLDVGAENGGVELVVPSGAQTMFEAYVCKKKDLLARSERSERWERERKAHRGLKNVFPSIGCMEDGKVAWNSNWITKRWTAISICAQAPGAICTPVGETQEDVPTRLQFVGPEMCNEQRDILKEDLRALRELETRGWQHGDVKPDNILRAVHRSLFSSSMQSRLIDFGQTFLRGDGAKRPSGSYGFLSKGSTEFSDQPKPEHDKISLLLSTGRRIGLAFKDEEHRLGDKYGCNPRRDMNLLMSEKHILSDDDLFRVVEEQADNGGCVKDFPEKANLDLGVRRLMGEKAWKVCAPASGLVDEKVNTLPGLLKRQLREVGTFL